MNGTILIFGLVMLFGFLLLGFGYALGRMSAPRKAALPPESPEKEKEQGKGQNRETVSPKDAGASPSTPAQAGLHMYADPQRGHRLVIHVDGVMYLRYDGMTAEHRRRLRTYLMQIRDWMESTGGRLPKASAPAARPVASAKVNAIPAQRGTTEAKDMVAGIDALLQAKLKASGSQVAVKIMRDWRGTGAVILVNGTRYDAVADIPDAEIRRLVQEAVQEWEARQRRRKAALGR